MAEPTTPFSSFDITKTISEFKIPGVDMDYLLTAYRKNIEALTAANNAAFDGMKALSARQTEILQHSIPETLQAVSEVAQAQSPEERIARQTDLARQTFETVLSNMKEVVEMTTKVNNEAAQLLAERVSASLEELKAAALQAKIPGVPPAHWGLP